MEQAGDRRESSAAEQSDSGAAGAGLNVQDHHGHGRLAGRHRAGSARELQRRRNFLRTLFQVLDQKHGARSTYQKAIYQSCDVFFYTLGEKLGIARIAKYATPLGLGQKTGIDLPQEVSGVMPSEEWKIRTYKQKWFAGETISVSIGQGAVAATPIQLARAIGAIAMDGDGTCAARGLSGGAAARCRQTGQYNDVKQSRSIRKLEIDYRRHGGRGAPDRNGGVVAS